MIFHSSNMSDDAITKNGAWKGGSCPSCGEDMPANVVHCISCRALLNSELTEDTVEIPEFVPLPEIHEMKSVKARGHYIRCEGCGEELRINSKYLGANVQCRHCSHTFSYETTADRLALYCRCPHCSEELRASMKYIGQAVACRFCEGPLQFTDE
ncbi:MAG: hypothetical protein ABJZ55_19415 [Fuerstiella sp.]